jgi:hypothetical protein
MSVIAEVYPSLCNRSYPTEGRDSHQHDAYSVARWMREQDGMELLGHPFHPELSADEKATARIEGWIFGLEGRPSA